MRRVLLGAALLGAISCALACDKSSDGRLDASSGVRAAPSADIAAPGEIEPEMLVGFVPLPAAVESKENALTDEKIALGRALFYDTRLSASHDISCNSCHILATDGADARKVSEGHKKQHGARNSPTVYNAAGHVAQFWDGRAKTLEEQARMPIMNPLEMGMTGEASVVAELAKVTRYREQFKRAFPEDATPLTMDNVARAIAAFERKLLTPSRWDTFLAGDANALTREEKAGFRKFVETGCAACHSGRYVGGHRFQKLGVLQRWPRQEDLGRYEVTKQESDKMVFKVPSLRNVARTAPYFHDGSVPTLEQAVRLMAKHQLAKMLSDAEVASIVTWLKALTGEIPQAYIAEVQTR